MFLSKISIHSSINHILHLRKKKHFCRFCLQSFRTEEILKCHIKDCLKINDKPKNEIHEKVNMLNSKIMKKNKVTIIYADFESILVSEDNEKQNLKEFYRNKYQKYIGCSYGYK